MSDRNRSEGWVHAKRSGHDNEKLVEELVSQNGTFRSEFLKSLGKENETIVNISIGGLNETDVECILGGKTKSKTDLKVTLSDGSKINISIKKSLGGQVYLIGANRFILGFEAQFGKVIPASIKEAISLFWGSCGDLSKKIEENGVNKAYEKRKNRLVGDSLKIYNEHLYVSLLEWFKQNTYEIFDFCFSKGLATDESEWANVVWYVNQLNENDVNRMFLIDELGECFKQEANHTTEYGARGGGTTIQLAFGFVQWHSPTKKIPGDMQFHHNYKKIEAISYKYKLLGDKKQ